MSFELLFDYEHFDNGVRKPYFYQHLMDTMIEPFRIAETLPLYDVRCLLQFKLFDGVLFNRCAIKFPYATKVGNRHALHVMFELCCFVTTNPPSYLTICSGKRQMNCCIEHITLLLKKRIKKLKRYLVLLVSFLYVNVWD